MNYYPFHIGDYAAHTRYLTLMEDLAYRRMLDLYYVSEKPLEPAEQTARLIGMRDHVAEVGTILADFFEATEAGFINKRANEELDKFSLMKQGGRDGAAKRWGKAGDREAIAPHRPPNHPLIATRTRTRTRTREKKVHRTLRARTPLVRRFPCQAILQFLPAFRLGLSKKATTDSQTTWTLFGARPR